MPTFRDLLTENEMSPEEFKVSVEKAFLKHFPNGFININTNAKTLGAARAMNGVIGIMGNPKDNSGGYADNDPMRHTFRMHEVDEGVYKFIAILSGLSVYPPEGVNLVMTSVKTKMGNASKLTLEKTNVKLTKFFKNLAGIVKDNQDRIYGVEKMNPKYLKVN
jgi:hypothetical protein